MVAAALLLFAAISFQFNFVQNLYWTVLSPVVSSFSETDLSTTSAIVEIVSNAISALCAAGGLFLTYRGVRKSAAE